MLVAPPQCSVMVIRNATFPSIRRQSILTILLYILCLINGISSLLTTNNRRPSIDSLVFGFAYPTTCTLKKSLRTPNHFAKSYDISKKSLSRRRLILWCTNTETSITRKSNKGNVRQSKKVKRKDFVDNGVKGERNSNPKKIGRIRSRSDGIYDQLVLSSSKDNYGSSSIATDSSSFGAATSFYPPWLKQRPSQGKRTTNTKSSNNNNQNQMLNEAKVKYDLYNLREKLQYHQMQNPKLFTMEDITSVINSVFVASRNDLHLISSTCMFLILLLDSEEYSYTKKKNKEEEEGKFIFMSRDTLIASSFHYCDCIIAREMGLYDFVHSVMRSTTNDNLNNGDSQLLLMESNREKSVESNSTTKSIENKLSNVIKKGGTTSKFDNNEEHRVYDKDEVKIGIESNNEKNSPSSASSSHTSEEIEAESNEQQRDQNLFISDAIQNNRMHTIDISNFGTKATMIYENVSKLKRIEIMTHAILPRKQNINDKEKVGKSNKDNRKEESETLSSTSALSIESRPIDFSRDISISRVTPSPQKAASVRGLLLTSSNGDWNALAIRLTASLYRLRGILQYQQEYEQQQYYDFNSFVGQGSQLSSFVQTESTQPIFSHNKEIVREAREALRIYAPLAQRLGMTKLKTDLENAAFHILYRRQYSIAQSLYMSRGGRIDSGGAGCLINTVASYLENEIEDVLQNDLWLINQLDRMTVMSRVKQPYSLWKKLMKLKKRSLEIKKEREKHRKNIFVDDEEIRNTQKVVTNTKAVKRTITKISQRQFQESEDLLPSLSLVQDAIALRVIIKVKENDDDKTNNQRSSSSTTEEFLCYYIQNRLMKLWPVIDETRVKDYISQPKPNGYQSLHHTSHLYRYGEEWPFEVSTQMNYNILSI